MPSNPTGPYVHIRAKYPRAYELWPAEDDLDLWRLYQAGDSVDELAQKFQRQPGAIRSRLRKLAQEMNSSANTSSEREPPPVFIPPTPDIPATYSADSSKRFALKLEFEWEPVLRDGVRQYQFPESLTPFMNRTYHGPAIYRWCVFAVADDALKSVYIGTTKKLCPDRIDGYLQPKISDTNHRLHKVFKEETKAHNRVALEILHVSFIGINGAILDEPDISSQSSRIFLESSLIAYYRQIGMSVLNL